MVGKFTVLCSAVWLLAVPQTVSAGTNQTYGLMSWNTACLSMTKKWQGYAGWKAIAVSSLFKNLSRGDDLPYQECGHSWKAPSRERAVEIALSQCNKILRKYGGVKKATCTIKTVEQ